MQLLSEYTKDTTQQKQELLKKKITNTLLRIYLESIKISLPPTDLPVFTASQWTTWHYFVYSPSPFLLTLHHGKADDDT